ncbi:MAG TPA: TerB family tellurite resistance protein [Candidatus Limnocylindria bacterium]|nr:TerB family tellurite resistance protein [Candidatus Limnocylindria bacterium]
MLDALKSFFTKRVQPVTAATDPSRRGETAGTAADPRLRNAACVLLLELAHSDDEFTADEQSLINGALMRHFDLDAETAQEAMALADQERRSATDLHQFTSLINRHYDEGQRMVLAELLWRVVYADGQLSKHEDYLARKLATLLELRPGYLAEARKRVIGERPSS